MWVKGYIKWVARILIVTLMCSLPTSTVDVQAFIGDQSTHDEKDIKTWCQAWFSVSQTRRLAKGAGSTISAAACSYFSMTYILAKLGAIDPKKESPIDIIDRVEKYNGWDTDWGHMDGSKVSKLEPDLKCDNYMMNLSQYSTKEARAILKGLYEKGKYLQVCVGSGGPVSTSGHYIFIDGFNKKGEMLIGDSGRGGKTWEYYYGKYGGYFKYVNVYSSVSGKKCNDMPSIYDDDVGKKGKKSSKKSSLSDEEKSILDGIESEWELSGMPDQFKLSDVVCDVTLPDGFTDVKDSKNMEAIRDNIQASKMSPYKIFQVSVSFLGIFMLLYAFLLFISCLLEYSNPFIEISFLKILTFGRVRILDEEDIKNDSKKTGWDEVKKVSYMSYKMIFFRCGIVLVMGMVLVSGSIFRVAEALVDWVYNLF